MRRFITSKKGIALLATVVVAAVAAIGAYAYFSSSGTGSNASATVGSASAFTLTIGNASGGPMYPGDTNAVETETYKVHNPSTGHQNLNQVVISVAKSDGTAWSSQGDSGKPACTKDDFELSLDGTTWATHGTAVTDTSIAANLAGGADSATDTVYIRMRDNGLNQDNCQGLTNVPLYYSAS